LSRNVKKDRPKSRRQNSPFVSFKEVIDFSRRGCTLTSPEKDAVMSSKCSFFKVFKTGVRSKVSSFLFLFGKKAKGRD
jgi:hypothetical protein